MTQASVPLGEPSYKEFLAQNNLPETNSQLNANFLCLELLLSCCFWFSLLRSRRFAYSTEYVFIRLNALFITLGCFLKIVTVVSYTDVKMFTIFLFLSTLNSFALLMNFCLSALLHTFLYIVACSKKTLTKPSLHIPFFILLHVLCMFHVMLVFYGASPFLQCLQNPIFTVLDVAAIVFQLIILRINSRHRKYRANHGIKPPADQIIQHLLWNVPLLIFIQCIFIMYKVWYWRAVTLVSNEAMSIFVCQIFPTLAMVVLMIFLQKTKTGEPTPQVTACVVVGGNSDFEKSLDTLLMNISATMHNDREVEAAQNAVESPAERSISYIDSDYADDEYETTSNDDPDRVVEMATKAVQTVDCESSYYVIYNDDKD